MRVSGPGTVDVLRGVCGSVPRVRHAGLRTFVDAEGAFDEGIVVFYRGPESYTGEDLAELCPHGNPLLVERLLGALCAAGARLARAGEFTMRALLNGRVDLVGAEAVLQTLTATSAAGLRVARRASELAQAAEGLRRELVDVSAELEAILDYPGEDLLFSSDAALAARLGAVGRQAHVLADSWRAGAIAVDGATVALVGAVNSGKSTLLNALLGRTRALVSPIPGTTRDVVEADLLLPGVRVRLLDCAGIRDTVDPIESAGIALGFAAAREADLRLLILPLDRPGPAVDLPSPTRTVGTFADLGGDGEVDLRVCAPTGEGIDALRAAIPGWLGGETGGGLVVASQRQRDLFRAVGDAVDAAIAGFGAGPAVVVEGLYVAVGEIDALLGRDTREAVLDRLFSRFCVGK